MDRLLTCSSQLTPLFFYNSKKFVEVLEVESSAEKISGILAGSNGDENAVDWHYNDFIVKDEALPVAVNYHIEIALFWLDYYQKS